MFLRYLGLALGSLALALPASPALAKKKRPVPVVAPDPDAGLIYRRADADLVPFYKIRRSDLLWFNAQSQLDPAARELLALVQNAEVDGVAPGTLRIGELSAALARFEVDRSPEARDQVELLLSRTLADYTRAMRTVSPTAMIYEHPVMQPRVPSAAEALWEATRAPSLFQFIHNLEWMHPMYAQLRQALMSGRYVDDGARTALLANMNRVRAIPGDPGKRYVLVDAANARLWMYENGQPVDSMKVIVGKPSWETPMMAGYLRYAIVNPYWNVPTSIVHDRTAKMVLSRGLSYLKASKFEVLSDFSPEAVVIDPATVDWKAAAAGQIDVRIRQLPMPSNSMGAVKFEFPNQEGIYLHDTPEMHLMKQDVRHLSHGCIRLEDAQRFGRWLFGQPLPGREGPPEQKLDLADPVPIYVTYLTAVPGPAEVTFVKDRYNRDVLPQSQILALSGISTASR
jgi:L,D-transpeptidase YcbB